MSDLNVSVYRDVQDIEGKPVSLSSVENAIKNGKWKKEITELRSLQDEAAQKAYKNTLPCFTASGIFAERKNGGLITHSNIMILDGDAKDNPGLLKNFDEIRQKLIEDKYTHFLFTSCRGNGLAVGVRMDGAKHLETFQYLEKCYKEKYGLTIDKGCKDVTRLRFISYDPDLYLNAGAETVIVPPDFMKEPKCSHTKPVSYANGKNHEIIKAIIASGKLSGDDSYNDWLKIGFALAQEFGEAGRGYFHELSKISPKYDPAACDRKFDNCLKTNRGDVTFATIVLMGRAVGVVFKNDSLWTPKALVNQTETSKVEVFNCTDLGNAKRLVAQYGEKIRYCHAWKKWLCWDGKTWSIDNNGQILRLAKDTVKRIYEEAGLISDDAQRKAVAKWAVSSESEHRINAMVSLAESEPGVPISPNELDTNPYLLNFLNETVDLRTGQLRQHNSKDFITKIIPVEYHPEATCPKWIEFLETIFNWNYDLILFTQRAVGYSLTGDTSEQCLFLLYGLGANGKSTFIDVVSMLLGDYSQGADFETFLIHKNETIRNDLARMTGRRFISAIESEGERRLAEVLIKQLTGGDTITARFLFGEYFDFKPTFKIWLAANHKPNIKGTDYAIWRRIKLIPFNVTIPEEKRISKTILMDTFKKELPGILTWAVQGCLEWQRNGLQTPEEVKTATNGYREEMDSIGAFLGECCILTPEVRSKASDLYGVYKKWCETGGEYALSQRGFGLRLTERGLERVKSSGNFWKGVGIKTEK